MVREYQVGAKLIFCLGLSYEASDHSFGMRYYDVVRSSTSHHR